MPLIFIIFLLDLSRPPTSPIPWCMEPRLPCLSALQLSFFHSLSLLHTFTDCNLLTSVYRDIHLQKGASEVGLAKAFSSYILWVEREAEHLGLPASLSPVHVWPAVSIQSSFLSAREVSVLSYRPPHLTCSPYTCLLSELPFFCIFHNYIYLSALPPSSGLPVVAPALPWAWCSGGGDNTIFTWHTLSPTIYHSFNLLHL